MTSPGDDIPSTATERVAKVIARAGLCSRREAEAWIAEGRVSVNGAVLSSPGVKVGPRDRIVVDGNPLPRRERTRLFLYHKPRGLVTTHADPQGRATIFQQLRPNLPRLISVGRLDFNTEGLLLLTNDGGLARMLELPSTGWVRRYRVRAHGTVAHEALDSLRAGISVDGVHYGPIEATLDRVQGANVWLTLALREGKNREVRNVLAHLGLTVSRLIRVSFGPFQLGDLPPGVVEEVKTKVLRQQLGERVAAAAGVDFDGPLSRPSQSGDALAESAHRTPSELDAYGGKEKREGRGPKDWERKRAPRTLLRSSAPPPRAGGPATRNVNSGPKAGLGPARGRSSEPAKKGTSRRKRGRRPRP